MKNKIKKEKIRKIAGFTILETLVAIFILILAVTGPMVFAQNSLKAAYISRDQITAFYLAQDIIEKIKNVRENNFVLTNSPLQVPTPWLYGIEGVIYSRNCSYDGGNGEGCSFDHDSFGGGYQECPDGQGCTTDEPLLINDSGNNKGDFNINTGTESKFARRVYLDLLDVGDDSGIGVDGNSINDELRIIVQVEFKTNSGENRIITVQENIYNWAK